MARVIRVAVIVFAAVTLTLNGAASAQRLFSALEKPEPQEEMQTSQLLPGPSAEHQKENVNPPSKPNSEPAAYISASATVEYDHSQSRAKNLSCQIRPEISLVAPVAGKNSLIVSTSAVSTYLGGQFTLVGAKPSGTS